MHMDKKKLTKEQENRTKERALTKGNTYLTQMKTKPSDQDQDEVDTTIHYLNQRKSGVRLVPKVEDSNSSKKE